jgi:hypothetical protein
MVDDKSPRLDSFLCEFYNATWAFVGPNLHQVYKKFVTKQSLGPDINKGTIRKFGDLKLITN